MRKTESKHREKAWQTSSRSITVTFTPTKGQTINLVKMRRMRSLKERKIKSKRKKQKPHDLENKESQRAKKKKKHIPESTAEEIQIVINCLKKGKPKKKQGIRAEDLKESDDKMKVVDGRYLERHHQTGENGPGLLEKVMIKVIFQKR